MSSDWYGAAIPNFRLVWRPPYLPYRFRRHCLYRLPSWILKGGAIQGEGDDREGKAGRKEKERGRERRGGEWRGPTRMYH